MSDLESTTQRVAIVTGGSRGIGREAVKRLAHDGFAVIVNYSSNTDEANAAVDEVEDLGGTAITIQGDVADEVAMSQLFDRVEAEFGGVDVVVNAAGRMALSTIADLDLDELDALHRTNIRGTFVVDQQAARRLRPGGTIINFSTSVLGTSFPAYGAYVASKGAVEALSLILARELRGRDVTVNTVAPGPTATDLFFEGKDKESIDRSANAVPLERLGTPRDIAELVAFLASPTGHWINGQSIRANGGLA